MKERPIPFSGAMVRAILAGTKTQTRRILKFRPSPVVEPDVELPITSDDRIIWRSGVNEFIQPCPYGRRGDRLWVRETWRIGDGMNESDDPSKPTYAADWPDAAVKWRPSIHMPRKFSRITLEVTGVRVERLNCITCEDAWAEGVKEPPDCGVREAFSRLWDSINAARAPWASNPWVWVVSFARASREGGR